MGRRFGPNFHSGRFREGNFLAAVRDTLNESCSAHLFALYIRPVGANHRCPSSLTGCITDSNHDSEEKHVDRISEFPGAFI
jgi:hypothetical protein